MSHARDLELTKLNPIGGKGDFRNGQVARAGAGKRVQVLPVGRPSKNQTGTLQGDYKIGDEKRRKT